MKTFKVHYSRGSHKPGSRKVKARSENEAAAKAAQVVRHAHSHGTIKIWEVELIG